MLFKNTSLLLTALALIGLILSALARHAGARISSLVAATVCVTISVVSLVSVAQATKTFSPERVPLFLAGYFAGRSTVPDRVTDSSLEIVPQPIRG